MRTILMILLCLFLPPVAVLLMRGLGKHFIINIILLIVTLDIGAIIHAFWLLSQEEA